MSKSSQFYNFLLKQPKAKLLFAASCLLLAISYPGHNPLQSIVLIPGIVRHYILPSPSFAPYPNSDGTKPPVISARSYLVQDLTSRTLMASKYPDASMLPASTTKLMTALVAIAYWNDLSTILTVKNQNPAIGQTIDLVTGEQLTLENLLYALLVYSGNDAALTIADNYCAPSEADGEVGSCGYAGFVAAMNTKASELHLDHTVYKNPSGIEQYGHITTARDLSTLATIALSNPTIAQIVTTKSLTITDVTGEFTHELEATDELIGVLPGLLGGKTGWTTNAGECFVALVERDGRRIITVVLGSSDRFGDTTLLVDWAYAHHEWVAIDSD